MGAPVALRALLAADCTIIAEAFAAQGWNKPAAQYAAYLREQEAGARDVLVAEVDGEFAGYLTIVWASTYPPFRTAGTPEIVDLNVLLKYQRRGVATALLDAAEQRIAQRAPVAGIGVGMTADYGAAQILYVQRGYRPDGRGLAVHGAPAAYGDAVTVDDDLVLYFTRPVRKPKRPRGSAIVETPQGIVLVAGESGVFLLPGGGVEGAESYAEATLRELREETALHAESALYLFDHESSASLHKVFYVVASGRPQLCNETRFIAYFTEDADIAMSEGTRAILQRFATFKAAHPARLAAMHTVWEPAP